MLRGLRRHPWPMGVFVVLSIGAAAALAVSHQGRYAAIALVAAGLAFGVLVGVPAALLAIAVPVRASVPVLHSLTWADSAILGAALCEISAGWVPSRCRPRAVALFVAFAVVSSAYSIDRSLTLRALILLGEGLALGLASRNLVARRTTSADAFLRLWLAIGLLSAVSALVLFYAATPPVWWNLQKPPVSALLVSDQLRLGSPFWGPSNYYASILLLFLPVAWLAAVTGARRALAVPALCVMATVLYLTTSRGAILALAGGGVCLIVRNRRSLAELASRWRASRRGPVIAIAVCAIVVASVAPELVRHFFLSRDTAIGSFASGDRLTIYRAAISTASHHLVVGVGYGAAFAAAPALAGGAHNYPLTLLLELGIPGLVLGVYIATRTLWSLGRRARDRRDAADPRSILVRATFAALVLTIIDVQVEASFEGVVFFWLFSALVGAALGAQAREDGPDLPIPISEVGTSTEEAVRP